MNLLLILGANEKSHGNTFSFTAQGYGHTVDVAYSFADGLAKINDPANKYDEILTGSGITDGGFRKEGPWVEIFAAAQEERGMGVTVYTGLPIPPEQIEEWEKQGIKFCFKNNLDVFFAERDQPASHSPESL